MWRMVSFWCNEREDGGKLTEFVTIMVNTGRVSK